MAFPFELFPLAINGGDDLHVVVRAGGDVSLSFGCADGDRSLVLPNPRFMDGDDSAVSGLGVGMVLFVAKGLLEIAAASFEVRFDQRAYPIVNNVVDLLG